MSETVDPGLLAAVRETSRLARFDWASQAPKHKMLWFAMWSDRYILWNWARSLVHAQPTVPALASTSSRLLPTPRAGLSTRAVVVVHLAAADLAATYLYIERPFQFGVKGFAVKRDVSLGRHAPIGG